MLCRAPQSLLAVVDIQTKLAAAFEPAALERVLEHCKLLLKAAKLLDIPVLATEQYPQGLGPTHASIKTELPTDTRLLTKTGFSCCAAQGFNADIQASGRKQIILIGMETHVCVLQTAAELHAQNLQVFVVEDAVISRSAANRQNALARMRQNDIQITNVESVLFEWMQDAKHPHFKEISRWIR